MKKYDDFYTEQFREDIKRQRHLKDRIIKKIDRLLQNPYELSEKLKYELAGLRSYRFDKNFRFIFAICEECYKDGQIVKSNNRCGERCDEISPETLIFLAFGAHEDAYRK